jgi:hypothetical protein
MSFQEDLINMIFTILIKNGKNVKKYFFIEHVFYHRVFRDGVDLLAYEYE